VSVKCRPHLQNYMCNARVSECQSVLSNEPHYAVYCESVTICVLGRVLGAFTRSGRTNFAFIFLSRVGMPVDACERDCNYDRHAVSLKHDGTDGSDGTDGTAIQSVSPVPSASVAGPSRLSVIAAVIN